MDSSEGAVLSGLIGSVLYGLPTKSGVNFKQHADVAHDCND